MKKYSASLLAALIFCMGAWIWAQGAAAAEAESKDYYSTVAAGDWHSLAIDGQGRLYTWGSNCFGQLGIGTQEIQTKPVPVMDGVRYASACDRTTVAIRADGTLWVWGHQSKAMYGEDDRKAYKDLKDEVKQGTDVLVYGTDMGYALIEYPVGDAWERSWIPEGSLAFQ